MPLFLSNLGMSGVLAGELGLWGTPLLIIPAIRKKEEAKSEERRRREKREESDMLHFR